jgi:hypothetical protein
MFRIVPNAEMLQGKVARDFIVGIPIARKVICTDRCAANAEVRPNARSKELAHDFFFVLVAKLAQGSPAQLVETRPKPLDRLQRCVELNLKIPLHMVSGRLEICSRRYGEPVHLPPLSRLSCGDPLGLVRVGLCH